ncbi:hypothetical protein ATSB10_33400 [Dyella thiooxydans]|uniref:Uncharacterized protein n=1 Tax=Dyella thiooxydans TaxID=445710 RepID=A0A160N4W9_9GAMM|nr:hypothetical protein [Dyella thiooxydans]AND70794.1 hypothetical protein ATSB10_33400 [Dyella thiooxydans]
MNTDDLAQVIRLISARQQADSVVIAALLTAHPDPRMVLDRLSRLADADSEDAELNQPPDPESMAMYRERLTHWIGLARRCVADRLPPLEPPLPDPTGRDG